MSRNRYDRDDEMDYYSGPRGGGGGGRASGPLDERYIGERGGYGRGAGYRERDYTYDDFYGTTRGGGRGYEYGGERPSYGRGRYGERADYRDDDRRYGDYRVERDEDDGRTWYEEGRDYLRRTFGGGGAAEQQRRERGGRARQRSRVRCRDIMTRDVTVATRDTTLQEVAAMMREEDTGVIPVVDRDSAPILADDNASPADAPRIRGGVRSNGKLIGLITDRDIVIRAVAEGKDAMTTRVEEVMTEDIHTAHPNDRVIDAIRKMGDKQVRRIPVVGENNQLRGIISMADIALETEEDRELADALEEISSGASFWGKVFG